ncbi:efflux RND transporter periplasmic adaptor subunit [Sorangium sp. So ce590]|uniref:efflux RND transporter periplasmic adaptor subunit n=1 Tax=Sorangium sp. So ce590 TaxID=3133317 RepID=UPI003F5E4D82
MSARRRRWRLWPWLAGALALAGTGAAVVAMTRGGPPHIDPALVVTARRGDLAVEILETGRIEAREKVEVKSKVAGQVAEVLADEGARVAKDQLLLVLDPIDSEREVARAEAELAQARAAAGYAKRVVARRTAGVEGSVIASEELDTARHELAEKTIAVRLAEVALSAAKDRLRYTKIYSPLDGTVIQRNIEPGEVVTPGVESTFNGKALLTVADLSTLVVKVDLNQIDVAKVALGQPATLTLDALPGKTYAARVTKIAPASVKLEGREVDVFPVEAELSHVDGLIRPGMTADVRIRLDSRPGVVSLPIEAVSDEGGKQLVTRVVDGPDGEQTTEQVEVALGARNDREVEIVNGVPEGARVLINPPSAAENETKM